jgi:uncharacterized repeat protein (TIGR01451 family)
MTSKDIKGSPCNGGDRRTCQPMLRTAVMAIMATAAFVCTTATSFALGIATNKLSYQTGEKVTVTGKGWRAYEAVTLVITSGSRTPIQYNVTAGSTGAFSNSSFILQDIDRGQVLTLRARGASGAETLLAFRQGTAPGALNCSSLTAEDADHYGISPGDKVSCSIQGAFDLSAAQQQGSDPVEVLVKSSTFGNQPAKVISVSGNTIYFEYTAPAEASRLSTVSYGPITACDPKSGKCTTFPTLGNDANSGVLSGGASAAGFSYVGGAAPMALMTTTGTNCSSSTCPAQLLVTKSPANGTFTQGSQVSFQITVKNNAAYGSASATNVNLTDQLPGLGGLTWQTATATQGSCNAIVGNALNCYLGTLAPQAFATVTVTSTPTTPASACVCQPNANATATADGGLMGIGSGTLNCTSNPQLKVEKTPDNGMFAQGAPVSFQIVVSNPAPAGSGAATGVVLTDTLPGNGGLIWSSATTTQGTCNPISANALNCWLGDIAPGNSVTVTVNSVNQTPAAACTYQPNAAAIATSTNGLRAQDSGSLNCVPPQLKVVKFPKAGTFNSGGQASFTIYVSNPSTGISPATNVLLTDTLPTVGGMSWTSVIADPPQYASCSITNNVLTCSMPSIQAGTTETIIVSSPSMTPASACTYQPNPVAIATADGGLTAQDSGSLSCFPAPQLKVMKTPDGGSFNQGSQVRYTIVVSNPAPLGSGSAMNVKLTDALPGNGGLVWNSAVTNSSQGSCVNPIVGNALDCSLGNIAPGASVTVNVLSTATTPAAACTSQPNPVALATADGGLTAQDSGSLSCVPPQLSVVKTPDNGTFSSGGPVSFTIVVSNPAPTGASPATNVKLTDALPGNGGLVWNLASTTQGTCNPIVGNALNCSLGTINPGSSVTVTVSSPSTPATACQSQPNPVALATADGGLSAQGSGSLNCVAPQLAIVKTPDNGIFHIGEPASFTIVVTNPGTVSATNVRVTDLLPSAGGLIWTSASTTQGSCVNPILSNNLNCTLGTIAAGGAVTVTVSTRPTTFATCLPQNNPAAVATADGGIRVTDSGSLNCIRPQLTVVKTPDNGTFQKGGQVTFQIVVSNPPADNASAATNVRLTDALPILGGLTWVTATTTQGSCVNPVLNNNLNCTLGTIQPGQSVTVTVSSPATTPPTACQLQNNLAAIATADGGLTARDSGSLTCTPCIIPGVTISNTSWNAFPIPAGTNPVVWVHAHIGTPSGIPITSTTNVLFTGVSININGTVYPLPDGLMIFSPTGPVTPTTQYDAGLNRWVTLVNTHYLSNEMFFTGAAIPVTPEIASGAKATFTYTVQSSAPTLSFPWQWSAAVYTYWPSDWNLARILAYHATLHAGTPQDPAVQRSLVQGPRGGGGSNFTGSWSATGNGTCP